MKNFSIIFDDFVNYMVKFGACHGINDAAGAWSGYGPGPWGQNYGSQNSMNIQGNMQGMQGMQGMQDPLRPAFNICEDFVKIVEKALKIVEK